MPSVINRALRHLGLLLSLGLLLGCVRPRTPTPGWSAVTAPPLQATTPASTPTPLPTVTPTPDAFAIAVDAYLTEETANGRFSGVILVAQQGRILFEQGYGQADQATGVPNTPQTRFGIGSLTKPFTAIAILQLQERGLVWVQDPIATYLPNCPPAWGGITVEHLLTHTAGLYDYFYLPGFGAMLDQSATPDELVALFRDQPLGCTPGERFAYSNSGYIVLGQIIEQVTGESYAHWLEANILAPLGMAATTYGRSSGLVETATGYAAPGQPAPEIDVSLAYAAGGLYSTVEDLYKWEQAFYTTRLLSQASLNALFQPRANVPTRKGWSYGYGWFIRNTSGRLEIFHPGLLYGYSAFLARFPDDRATIILLSNLEEAPLADHVDRIAEMLFGE